MLQRRQTVRDPWRDARVAYQPTGRYDRLKISTWIGWRPDTVGITGVIMSENDERSSTSRTVRELGEDRSIPRRDFIQGALAASATVLAGPLLRAYGADAAAGPVAAQDVPGYYPPLLNGLRGSPPAPIAVRRLARLHSRRVRRCAARSRNLASPAAHRYR